MSRSPSPAAPGPAEEAPAFEPRITGTPGCQFYEDNRVFGAVESGVLPDGRTFLRIDEWSSHFPGKGHAGEALAWLRGRHEVITANGVGTVDEGVGDIATGYWVHAQAKGLVDVLLLDDGTELLPGTLPDPLGEAEHGASVLSRHPRP